jgi:hypothetical protein
MSNFKRCTLTIYYYGDEVTKDEMRGVCGPYEQEEIYIQCFGGETWRREPLVIIFKDNTKIELQEKWWDGVN